MIGQQARFIQTLDSKGSKATSFKPGSLKIPKGGFDCLAGSTSRCKPALHPFVNRLQFVILQ